jgi:hypothetical protein
MHIHQGELYIGGDIQSINHGGGATATGDVARWDGAQWHQLDVAGGIGLTQPGFAPFVSVNALLLQDGQLYAGGHFSVAGEGTSQLTQLRNLARWDGQRWHPVGDAATNGPNAEVFSLAEFNGQLAVGGVFVEITQSGVPSINARGIALWDGSNWSALGTGVRSGRFPHVRTLLADGDAGLYVGGQFGQAGPHHASNLGILEQVLFSSGFE